MADYRTIDPDEMIKADWQNQGEANLKAVVADVKYNDDTLLAALKEIQVRGKKALGLFAGMLKDVEKKVIRPPAFPLALKSAARFKRELERLVAEAQLENDKYTNAMIEFRQKNNYKDGNITDEFAKRLGNLRTMSMGRAKMTGMVCVKLREAYTKLAGAMSSQLKVMIKAQTGDAQEIAALDGKADSLVEKLKTSVAEAQEQSDYMLTRFKKIDECVDKKGPKYGSSAMGLWGDFEKAQSTYKMHLKTADVQFDALKKIEAALKAHRVKGADRDDKVAEAKRELDKLDANKKDLEKAYKASAKATNAKDVEIPLPGWRVPEFKIK